MSNVGSSIILSGEIAAAATAAVGILGVPLAFGMARWRFFGKTVVEAFIMAPLVLPPTVVGYMILLVFGTRGLLGAWLFHAFGYAIVFRFEGAVLAAAIVAFPLLYIPTKAAFQGVDRELEDVSRLFGATKWQMFWQISLPLAKRGILSGLVLAFARALGEFGATIMVYGWQQGHVTLPISIYADYTVDDLQSATPAVVALALASLILVMGYNHWARVTKNE